MGKHIVVTGANGFVGRALVDKLLNSSLQLAGGPVETLTLVDLDFPQSTTDSRVRRVRGNIAEPGVLESALGDGTADVIFHLASVPGGKAEQHYELGQSVNLGATLRLLDLLSNADRGVPPRLVFASTIAVYGTPLPDVVDESSPLRPHISYGAHKLVGEVMIEDLTRRGAIDGRILRLPGIVARPLPIEGMLSAFMSELFWYLRDGRPFECPVSPEAVAWWMSVDCCAHNLMHAADLPADAFSDRRAFALPVLRLTIQQVVDGLCQRFGEDRRALVRYQPNERLEAAFGRFPPIETRASEALGFCSDGTVSALIEQALGRADMR